MPRISEAVDAGAPGYRTPTQNTHRIGTAGASPIEYLFVVKSLLVSFWCVAVTGS